jgi:hypothetical protein
MNIGQAALRVLFYATHLRDLRRRLGQVPVRGRSISYLRREVIPHYLRRGLFYLLHPAAAYERFQQRGSGIRLRPFDFRTPQTWADVRHSLSGPALANVLYNDGLALLNRDPHALVQAIESLSTAFALHRSARIGVKLADLQRHANRHDDASSTLNATFRANPDDREVWYESLIHVLRHGQPADARDLLDSILSRDPAYPLAHFFKKTFDEFANYVDGIERSLSQARSSDKPIFAISVAVWGEKYTSSFLRYTLASLLAVDNLPSASGTHAVHFIIFTTASDKARISAHPHYAQACMYAQFHFVLYDDALVAIARSEHFPTACHARFGLMSSAHYAVLECARRIGFAACILGADNVVNNGFLAAILDHLSKGDVGAIGCPGFRLQGTPALRAIEARYRSANGSICISGPDFSRLLCDHLPEAVFVTARDFARFPLFLCWRVRDEGILVHANHYHPVAINGRFLREIKNPSIDPIDGRFLVRYLSSADSIRLSTDSAICLADAGDNPLVVPPHLAAANKFREENVGLWLWQYDDGLRERYFRNAVRYSFRPMSSDSWSAVAKEADETVDRIVEYMQQLNRQDLTPKTWRI